MKPLSRCLAVWLACTGQPVIALAQQDPPLPDSSLREAVRLVTEGQGAAARSLVRGRLAAAGGADTLLPAVLYAAGVVADHADSAVAYFRRVSVEFANSPWAPAALVRLAQYAFANADYHGVLRTTDRLRLDYPASVFRAAAAFWGGRAHLELDDPAAGCARLREVEAEAGQEVELANRARFYLQRCAAVATRDTALRDSTARTPPAWYSVQVAAVQSPLAADELMRRLRDRGHDPRVVREADGLLKIRVGHVRTRPEAQRLVEQLRTQFGGSPFVVEERP
ncbi:MAG TPA: SPOR domain-containing protein [Gemmatimonadales bacterium]|nr:SPOR domain-containing protein [Gemmatimonadales bacterium]